MMASTRKWPRGSAASATCGGRRTAAAAALGGRGDARGRRRGAVLRDVAGEDGREQAGRELRRGDGHGDQHGGDDDEAERWTRRCAIPSDRLAGKIGRKSLRSGQATGRDRRPFFTRLVNEGRLQPAAVEDEVLVGGGGGLVGGEEEDRAGHVVRDRACASGTGPSSAAPRASGVTQSFSWRSVMIQPGAIELMRMLNWPSSRARPRVRPRTPALAAV